ncbi:hypothetical protein PC116_g17270 [Phytophthora cactorum]|uniref:Uncharacterized protein n=1 Tax=Phytophthora cactorum TaxID=29920 RepID=A0A8T1KCX8_9STRA|nr:hypothetical protein Pcac1_g26224 [Phytophthora cactorum]KAG2807821.1 hypothetical protein PC112_g17237 [Phytophthora cactorum]KAG2900191.1 hypothetical protein PC114_g13638 [Phytophthora cactorum]KAG2914400.1 hypothetical protein PC117_g18329 [Phytophthora cactorum]KAG3005809.1 hypothetical protein PC120_g17745 [Phytophthora cactorum]
MPASLSHHVACPELYYGRALLESHQLQLIQIVCAAAFGGFAAIQRVKFIGLPYAWASTAIHREKSLLSTYSSAWLCA